MNFQMISNNRSPHGADRIVLSTVLMPEGSNFKYETCLLVSGDSEVVGQTNSLSVALANHVKLRDELGLK